MNSIVENSEIRLLSSEVVDQIAAGEVVERPSHLVKELVENSIDAGATSVEIEFDQGGRRVRVTDNGRGILPNQLGLALARHATSKITSANDLWSIGTFGFRGEALASIAAVSRLTLQSRVKDQGAHSLFCEFGQLQDVTPVGGNPGTTVLIEDLYSNVPARLKFLKSEAGEASQIKATLRALALINQGVEFRLRTKGKTDLVWPRASTWIERARQVLDSKALFENEIEASGYHAHVVFASPHEVVGSSRSIWIFVQNRWVQDRGLQAAVIDAFRGTLMHGEFPIAAVRLSVPSDEVDVNIHPTKSQVKLSQPQVAFRMVHRAVREGLERAPWLEDSSATKSQSSSELKDDGTKTKDGESEFDSSNYRLVRKKLSVAELTRPYQSTVSQTPSEMEPRSFESAEFNQVQFKQKKDWQASGYGHREATYSDPKTSLNDLRASAQAREKLYSDHSVQGAEENLGSWSKLQVLGQLNLTYIVAQDDDRMILIDQHAAHERVAYEKLMRAWLGGHVDVQNLLLPLTVELDTESVEAVMSVQSDLEKLGVQLDQMGPTALAVRSHPLLLRESALVKTLSDLGRELVDRGGSFALEKKISDLCATLACHSVVRAGEALSMEQMKGLLRQMDEFPLSSFCPHGRPVSVDYSFSRLERDFGRLV